VQRVRYLQQFQYISIRAYSSSYDSNFDLSNCPALDTSGSAAKKNDI